jgi:hypothetical protein
MNGLRAGVPNRYVGHGSERAVDVVGLVDPAPATTAASTLKLALMAARRTGIGARSRRSPARRRSRRRRTRSRGGLGHVALRHARVRVPIGSACVVERLRQHRLADGRLPQGGLR